jgi:hypothetical protein
MAFCSLRYLKKEPVGSEIFEHLKYILAYFIIASINKMSNNKDLLFVIQAMVDVDEVFSKPCLPRTPYPTGKALEVR